jgi:hypothetical protein
LKERRAATPEEYLSSLADYGTLPELLATGAYGWSDLANGNDESLPFLDNDLCERFMSAISSQADIKISLAGELARVLPVPSGAFEFESDVTCGPKVAHKTRGDQQAVFEVSSMQISAFYLYFASGATYVTYADTALDRSAQLAEASALLGEDTVRVALQDALRRVFLALLKADLGLWIEPSFAPFNALFRRRNCRADPIFAHHNNHNDLDHNRSRCPEGLHWRSEYHSHRCCGWRWYSRPCHHCHRHRHAPPSQPQG